LDGLTGGSSTPAFWMPPPIGVVAQRRPTSTVMIRAQSGSDRAGRTSGGLPADFDDETGARSSWIATLDILRIVTGAWDGFEGRMSKMARPAGTPM